MTPEELRAHKKIIEWRKNPVLFVESQFQVTPDPWQKDLLMSFADPTKRRIAMKSAKGPGKTAGLAWCIWNFLSCYGEIGNHPKGAATSITEDNIDDNLWPELSKWQSRSIYLRNAFTWKKERIYANDFPETWFFAKKTWPKSGDKTQQANTLAGLHSKYLLFVLDESGGIPDSVAAAAEGSLTGGGEGGFQKIVQAGNPTHLEGPLYRACTSERHMWHLITVTGDPSNPNRSSRISIEWANEQIEKYGRENPWVLVNVFGEFPPSSMNTLLGPDEVEAAMKRTLPEDVYGWAQKRLGVDVARFGDDRTVIFPRQGKAAFTPVVMRNARTTDIAARVAMAKEKWGSEAEFIDDSGHWGHGVIDNLIAAGHSPMAVFFEGKALDPRFRNKRTEMWLNMADWVKSGGALPPVNELVRELTSPTYTFVNGVFQLEPKDMIKKRLGVSPDYGDALALTFFYPDTTARNSLMDRVIGTRINNAVHEFDPYAEATVR